MVRDHRAALREVVEPLPSAVRARERLPDRAAALAEAHFPGGSDSGLEVARRRLAFDELLLAQLTLHAPASAPQVFDQGPGAGRRARSDRAVAGGHAPVLAHRRPVACAGRGRRRPEAGRPHAAAADGGSGVREDRGRAVRAAACGRARLSGRVHGPDRDARRAALRDDPAPHAWFRCADRAADRIHARAASGGRARQAVDRRAAADRRNPCPDRGHGAVRAARRCGGRRAAPVRRAAAGGPRCQGGFGSRPPSAAACPAYDRDADPSHAGAFELR